jgi:hypothetical protein
LTSGSVCSSLATRARPPRTPLKAKRAASAFGSPEPVLKQAKAPLPRNRAWPTGPDQSFCHQCRRKTYYLKMTCVCQKKYCSRCIAIRFVV